MTSGKRLAGFLLWTTATLQMGCPGDTNTDNRPVIQTQINGFAPLHKGGHVRVLGLDGQFDDRQPDPVVISNSGEFVIELGHARGNFAIEAVGGHHLDPVDNQPVSMREDATHAVIYGLGARQTTDVVLTPWNDLLYHFAQARPGAAQHKAARLALENALGCSDRGLTRALPIAPSADVPLRSSSAAEVAYVHLGAWAQLARNVSQELNLNDNGVPMARLVRAIGGALAASGKIDAPIEVVPGKFLPPDVLRQRFAQAARQFLDQGRAEIAIDSKSVANLLNCTSRGFPDMWGPAGEDIDLVAPTIELDEPVVLGSPGQIKCVANDTSGVANVSIDANQNGHIFAGEPVIKHVALSGQGEPEAASIVTFDPSSLEAGDVVVRCSAVDMWGNRSEKSVIYGVNKGAVQMNMVASPSDVDGEKTYVRGKVEITCTCVDVFAFEDDACRLDDASEKTAGMGPGIGRPGATTYVWDTESMVDGEKPLACQARSKGIAAPIVAHPLKIHVRNHDPMLVTGTINLDTPVRDMQVAAWAWRDGAKGKMLAKWTDAVDGTFRIRVTNEYAGPILFEAQAAQTGNTSLGSYTSLATGETMYIQPKQRLTLLWDGYSAAEQMPRLTINAATTIAQAYASALFHKGPDDVRGHAAAAIATAHQFMRQHLQPDGQLDPRTTPVGDLSVIGAQGAGTQNSLLAGLFHVGMSRLAAERGPGPDKISVMDLLAGITEDLNGDATLNGYDAKNDEVWVGQYRLTVETLRRDLAHATRHWLDNRELHQHVYKMSTLDASAYSRPKRYLRWLAANNAAVFGGAKVLEFDVEPPELAVAFKCGGDENWSELEDFEGRVCRGTVSIHVAAKDDSEIVSLTAAIQDPEQLLKPTRLPLLNAPEISAEYSWNSRGYGDRSVTIVVDAWDRYDNHNPVEVTFGVDNTPPKVDMPEMRTSNHSDISIYGTADKAVSKVRILQNNAEIGVYETSSHDGQDAGFTIDVDLDCDAEHALAAVATDLAGNESLPYAFRVKCDTAPPIVEITPTITSQDFDGGGLPLVLGRAKTVPMLHKYITRLDDGSVDIPKLHVTVDDVGGGRVGSPIEQVNVEWKYEFNGGERETAWQPLPRQGRDARGVGHYDLELSYQNLLPEAVSKLDVVSARAGNFIARSKSTDRHAVLFRATDEFGNSSQVEKFEFFLDLRMPPIHMNCENVLAGQATRAQIMQVAQTGFMGWISFDWASGENVSDRSLAPNLENMGSAQIELPDTDFVWKTEFTTKQIAVLKRWTGSYYNNTCPDEGQSWARRYDDNGECNHHNGDPKNNRWIDVGGPTYTQRMLPQSRTIFIQPRKRVEKVAYASLERAPLSLALDYHQKERLQYQVRTAVEHERHVKWGNPDVALLDERFFAWRMAAKPGWPSTPSVILHGGLPPTTIERGPGCHMVFGALGYQDEHEERQDNGMR